ncbi:MAG: pantetheine-phosphate adenylyltransferase [bacterium]
MRKIAVYPGSFDPLTYGHLDVIKRSLEIFDKVIVAVIEHPHKSALFTLEERVGMLKATTKSFKNVKVDGFRGLLVNYVKAKRTNIVIRGLRAISDFEYELQMVLMNRRLNNSIDTIFLMPDERYSYLSSGLVKEIVAAGGKADKFVPEVVEKALHRKFDIINKTKYLTSDKI